MGSWRELERCAGCLVGVVHSVWSEVMYMETMLERTNWKLVAFTVRFELMMPSGERRTASVNSTALE